MLQRGKQGIAMPLRHIGPRSDADNCNFSVYLRHTPLNPEEGPHDTSKPRSAQGHLRRFGR